MLFGLSLVNRARSGVGTRAARRGERCGIRRALRGTVEGASGLRVYVNLGKADALFWKTVDQADKFSLDLIIRLMNGGFHKHATCLFEKTLDKAFQFNPDDIIRLFKKDMKRRAFILFEKTMKYVYMLDVDDIAKLFKAGIKAEAKQLFDQTSSMNNGFSSKEISILYRVGMVLEAGKLFRQTYANKPEELQWKDVTALRKIGMEDESDILSDFIITHNLG